MKLPPAPATACRSGTSGRFAKPTAAGKVSPDGKVFQPRVGWGVSPSDVELLAFEEAGADAPAYRPVQPTLGRGPAYPASWILIQGRQAWAADVGRAGIFAELAGGDRLAAGAKLLRQCEVG